MTLLRAALHDTTSEGSLKGGVCAESLQLDKSNRFGKTENLIRLKVISVGHTNQVGEKAEGIKKSVN